MKINHNPTQQTLIRLGLPKGSLQESTFDLFRRAGFSIACGDRSYYPWIDDPEIEAVLIRAQEIPRYVEKGVIDAGITGLDWLKESGASVKEIANLVYAKAGFRPVRWVLAVPEDSSFKKPEDLREKNRHRTGQRDPELLLRPGDRLRGGVFLGGDRSQTPTVGRWNR